MKKHHRLSYLVLISLTLVFNGCKTETNTAKKQPNIVFILADDLGLNDLSNEGSTYYESPNIDKISRMGMKFNRGYAACQVCSPSRASILSGKYTTKHGITTWIGAPSGKQWRKLNRHDSHLPPEYAHVLSTSEYTLAEAFRDNGYETFFAGKWHLGDKGSWPEDHGFNTNIGGYHAGSPRGGYFSPYNNPKLTDGPAGESLPVRLGMETAQFIEANKDKPFLAYLSFYSVHGPIQTNSKLWNKYRNKALSTGLAEKRFIFDRKLAVRQVQDCPVYAGLIESMDDAVGIVLDKLDQLGLSENTIICFTSDNGGVSSGDDFSTACLPLRGGKGRQWEGGLREPFYIYAPKITKPESKCDIAVSGIDWYPTLAELAGIEIPKEQDVDGLSLVPLLKGKTIAKRPLYWHYPHYGNQGGDPSSIILEEDWKLIYYHEDGRYELYNIANDEGEQLDLAHQYPEKVNKMKSKLMAWLKETNARFPVKDPDFDPAKKELYLKNRQTAAMELLEKKHAAYLDPNYQPDSTWWGSAVED